MHASETFPLVVGMFLAVVVPHHMASRLRVPLSVTLLVGGGALAFIPGLPVIALDPELRLVAVLPPLPADSAWFTALASVRRHVAGILRVRSAGRQTRRGCARWDRVPHHGTSSGRIAPPTCASRAR